MYIVYGLLDPRDNKVHYVGMTDNVYKRLFSHVQCSGNNLEKNIWITSLREDNVMVQMLELERTEDIGYARVREVYWINHYRMLQHPITNIQHANLRFVKNVLVRTPQRLQKVIERVNGTSSHQRILVTEYDRPLLNGPVESIPTSPDTSHFVPQGDDKLVPDNLHDDLVYWYGKLNNVQKARCKIGLTNSRYQRHASFILEQRGYKS